MADELMTRIRQAVVDGDVEATTDRVKMALNAGIPALRIIDEALVPGIQDVGNLFECKEYFLPDLMLGAKAMEAGTALTNAALGATSDTRRKLGTVVLGTVQGDIHEIGKNLVALMLRVNGFEVHDLGVNVPTARFVQAAREHGANLVGLSALLTSTMAKQREVIEALRNAGLAQPPKVMVGGAPINQEWAERIGADGYSPDAAQAVKDARRLLQVGTSA